MAKTLKIGQHCDRRLPLEYLFVRLRQCK